MSVLAIRWKIAARVRSGESIADIAAELQTTPDSIRSLVDTLESHRTVGRSGRPEDPKRSELRADICALCDAGKRPSDIVKELGCSLTFVYQTMREYRPNRSRAPRRSSIVEQEKINKIIRLTGEGWRQNRVARELGVTPQYISQVLSRHKTHNKT